jgi:LmbE family N-acetylglucosaminyl deacetylase
MMFKLFKEISSSHRGIVISIGIFLLICFFGLGTIGGLLLSRGNLVNFPDISKDTKMLIIAPHIDDEVIGSAGIIQDALNKGAKIKIVYVTNGDDSIGAVAKENKSIYLKPNEFINLGVQRMQEGVNATKVLGVNKEDLIFLGYPDEGLYSMLTKFYGSPYTSASTKYSFNPYAGTFRNKQAYTGKNFDADLKQIIGDFSPTIIIAPHPRDRNPDHKASYLFLETVLAEMSSTTEVFSYLVHYRMYPPTKQLLENGYMYPPKNLSSQNGWYSFNLTDQQKTIKLEAIKQNVSQQEFGKFYDLLQSFVKRNEIFERMN